MTRGVKIRLVTFVILAAVGIVYIAATYLGIVDKVLGRGLTVHATLGSGTPMTPIVDTGARTLTLRTGPLAGPPGDAAITIDAYADAGTNALAFDAPTIELDMQIQELAFTMTLVPELAAPEMLVAPRCTTQ